MSFLPLMWPRVLPGVGLVCFHSQLPPPPPGFLTDWEISKLTVSQSIVGIKLTFDVLGENPLYADSDCDTVNLLIIVLRSIISH